MPDLNFVAKFFKKRSTFQRILIAIFIFWLISLAVNSSKNSNVTIFDPSKSPSSQAGSSDTFWAPTGFNVWSEDTNVAYRWAKNSEFKCQYGDYCNAILVISKNGCPNSLYAEIALLDSAGTQVGYDNDTASSIPSMGKAKLQFEYSDQGSETARITKISCY
jgi:hypothetical protein